MAEYFQNCLGTLFVLHRARIEPGQARSGVCTATFPSGGSAETWVGIVWLPLEEGSGQGMTAKALVELNALFLSTSSGYFGVSHNFLYFSECFWNGYKKYIFLSTKRSHDVLHHVFPCRGNSFPSIPISADFPIPHLTELCSPRASCFPVCGSSLWAKNLMTVGVYPCPSSSCWHLKPPRTGPMASSAFISPAHYNLSLLQAAWTCHQPLFPAFSCLQTFVPCSHDCSAVDSFPHSFLPL